MKKQEFMDLFNAQDEISAQKLSNALNVFCETSEDPEVQALVETLDTLEGLEDYMNSFPEDYFKKPYTMDDAMEAMKSRLVQRYFEQLEE